MGKLLVTVLLGALMLGQAAEQKASEAEPEAPSAQATEVQADTAVTLPPPDAPESAKPKEGADGEAPPPTEEEAPSEEAAEPAPALLPAGSSDQPVAAFWIVVPGR